MAADAISFFRIRKDGLTAEMRRSWTCLEETFVAEFGESVYNRPAVAKQLQVECNQSCMLDGILDTMRELAAFQS